MENFFQRNLALFNKTYYSIFEQNLTWTKVKKVVKTLIWST